MTADVEDFVLTEEDALDDVARLNTEIVDAIAELEGLRTEVRLQRERANTQANRADQAVRELQAFKNRVVEVGAEAAENHDWCAVYDEIMSDLGLPGRVRSFEVEVKVSYQVTVSVEATSQDDAETVVNDTDLSGTWRPGLPFTDSVSMASIYASDIEVEVV